VTVSDNYQSKNDLYKAENVFDTLNIDLKITNTEFDDNLIYLLKGIEVDSREHDSVLLKDLRSHLKKAFRQFEINHTYTEDHVSWSVFYTLKEIIDQINDWIPVGYKTVYRGQPGNWKLRPSLFRSGRGGYSNDFRRNYEQIYV